MTASSRKACTTETHRAVAISETLAMLKPLLPRFGITRVANLTGLDRIGIPVVMVVRPNSRSVVVSQGKGLTLEGARVSGLMESIETWHAERTQLPMRYDSYDALSRERKSVDVTRLPMLSSRTFSPTRKSLWVEADDLVCREPIWLPYELVHTDYTHPIIPQYGCFACSTNGLASGNELREATVHAICELIERDATSLWHHLPQQVRSLTRVRPESIGDDACLEAISRISNAGFELAVWETTSDIGVASFRCMIVEPEGRDSHIGIGDGCSTDPGIALFRALTEAVQTRMTYVSGARDDVTPDEFTSEAVARKCRLARTLIRDSSPKRHFDAAPRYSSNDFADDLKWLIDRLKQVGCGQVLRCDLTRQDIGLAVVRIVIPGLEAPHDDEGYEPGVRARRAVEIHA